MGPIKNLKTLAECKHSVGKKQVSSLAVGSDVQVMPATSRSRASGSFRRVQSSSRAGRLNLLNKSGVQTDMAFL